MTIAGDRELPTNTPLWASIRAPVRRSELALRSDVDVCVVGAGISGMSAAYELALRGKRVLVLDDGPIGGGATGRSSAHLSTALDAGVASLVEERGLLAATLAVESHEAAIDRIELISAGEQFECDFERVDGYLIRGEQDDTDRLRNELRALERVGAKVATCAQAPILGFDSGACVRFARQAVFHPMRYLVGLTRAIENNGGRIVTGVRVTEIQDGERPLLRTDDGRQVRCSLAVVATNRPASSLVGASFKRAASRTYCLAFIAPEALVAPALFWDTDRPYHYLRVAPSVRRDGSEVLIAGGEDHASTSHELVEGHFDALERWTRRRFPMCREVFARWTGEVTEPVDGLAYIGLVPNKERVMVISGDSGHGLTHGVIGGMLAHAVYNHQSHPWLDIYAPARGLNRSSGVFGVLADRVTRPSPQSSGSPSRAR